MKNYFLIIPLIWTCVMNGQTAEPKNKALAQRLDSIYWEDQTHRRMQSEVLKRFGARSNEYASVSRIVNFKDSVNQVQVKAILDKSGWLGADVVGERGNQALFLVVQHSNEKMQEKYLPMMREAVKKGKVKGSSLALLEDRLALSQGKMQVYGSQVIIDSTGTYVSPIEDVDHVDERRAEVGLRPMAEYLQNWKLTWSVEQYKKELPSSPAYRRWLAWKEELERRKR